jgi:hypothetical protein
VPSFLLEGSILDSACMYAEPFTVLLCALIVV